MPTTQTCLIWTAGIAPSLANEIFIQSYRPAAFVFIGFIRWLGFAMLGFIFPFLIVSPSHTNIIKNMWVIPCQLNHWSLAGSNFDFVKKIKPFIVKKAKILNVKEVYLWSNPLYIVKAFIYYLNGRFHLRGKNDFRKMAASLLYFYTEIGLLVNRLTLAKKEKIIGCNSRSIKDILLKQNRSPIETSQKF